MHKNVHPCGRVITNVQIRPLVMIWESYEPDIRRSADIGIYGSMRECGPSTLPRSVQECPHITIDGQICTMADKCVHGYVGQSPELYFTPGTNVHVCTSMQPAKHQRASLPRIAGILAPMPVYGHWNRAVHYIALCPNIPYNSKCN